MQEQSLTIYLVVVACIGLVFFLWVRKKLYEVKKTRSERVRDLDNLESIDSTGPSQNAQADAVESAAEKVETRFSIISNISLFAILLVCIIAFSLPFLSSIPATLVSVLVAVASAVLGIAARPVIENIIAGIVISFSRAVRVGDTVVIDEHYGTVEDINLTHTIIKLWNWKRLIIPSNRMLAKEVVNYTYHDSFIWVHIEFYISYSSDLEQVRQLALAAPLESKFCSDYEAPGFWVMAMEKDAYQCWLAAWANSPIEAWTLASDMRTEVAIQLQKQGVKTHSFSVGFNQLDTHNSVDE